VSPTKTATRGQLSRALVVDRALVIADAEGLEAVTIRRLATELDVTPMALYWHFRTKDDLLAGTADRVLDELAIPPDTGSWASRIQAAITALVEALRPHPQVAMLVAHRILLHPTGLALTETALACLSEAGFTPAESAQMAEHALQTAIMLVTGNQVDDSGSVEQRDGEIAAKTAMIASLPADQYPHLKLMAADLMQCQDVDQFFALGVEHFVAGLQGLAAARRA
jgi:TetR/AcrR family tetracycline transcriptional repressor